MASFNYTGRDQNGKLVKGTINASSKEAIAEQLLKQQIIPLEVTRSNKSNKPSIFKRDLFGETLKREDMIILCRQLCTMIRVGIPIVDSLNHIAESTQSAVLITTLPQVAEAISSGKTLTDSLKMHPKVFDQVAINLIAAGENSGLIEQAFTQLAEHLEREDRSIKRIKSATRYPMIVIIAGVVAIIVINFFVLPSFVDMFASFKTELPLPTRIMMGMSNFMIAHWGIMLIAIIFLIIAFKLIIKRPAGQYLWHKFLLKMPIIGKILNNVIIGRFARMFSMMLEAGIPLIKAINLVSNTLGNAYVSRHMSAMCEGIERGDSLTNVARESNIFSPMVIQMIAIGEETGSLDSLLLEVALFHESEVDYDLDRLGDMIEPILLGFIGILVLCLALAVFLPMWNMTTFVKKG